MANIIGVKFREGGRVYSFDPGDIQVQEGDHVIVDTVHGADCGIVAKANTEVPDEKLSVPLKLLIRLATEDDLQALESKAKREADAFVVAEKKIAAHKLDMKLVSAEYAFDGSKILFRFTADERVDFRALVRDLAGVLRTRIELRQIGVRDQAKLLGGLGVCGRPFCCSSFMDDFHPVSVKMAKDQNLSLNPTKISGTCGRLMCCLKYEEAAYADAAKWLPKPGDTIETPDGKGIVTEVNSVSANVRVRLENRTETGPQVFRYVEGQGIQKRVVPSELGGILDSSAIGAAFTNPSPKTERQTQARSGNPQNNPRNTNPPPQTEEPKAFAPPPPPAAKPQAERNLPRYGKITPPADAKPAPTQEPKPQNKPPQRSNKPNRAKPPAPPAIDIPPAPPSANPPAEIPEGPRRAIAPQAVANTKRPNNNRKKQWQKSKPKQTNANTETPPHE
jgi:cell fate regulator YaaT (PSP1 superfamily)